MFAAAATETGNARRGAEVLSPRVVGTIAVPKGGEFLAMVAGLGGKLWVTRGREPSPRPVSGRLLRVDPSGKIGLTRSIGGDPVALAASGSYIWVVNGIGDGATPEADAGTVLQIDPTAGRILHRYRIKQPG